MATISFEAEVACGVPGCPWTIKVQGTKQWSAQERLKIAIAEHEKICHGD